MQTPHDMTEAAYAKVMASLTKETILSTPGIYEVLSEEYANDITEAVYEETREILEGVSRDKLVVLLEGTGRAVYDDEDQETLAEAVFESIKAGDIDIEEVRG